MPQSHATPDMITLAAGTYCGDGAPAQLSGGIRLTETVHAPHAVAPRHTHEEAYFCYVLGGVFHERSATRSYRGNAGTLIFHPAGAWHDDRFGDVETRCLNVEIPATSAAGRVLFGAGTPPDGVVGGRAGFLAAALARELHDWDSASPLVADGIVLGLAAVLSREASRRPRSAVRPVSRAPSTAPRWTGRAAELLRASLASPPGLRELATQLGVGVATLHRRFPAAYGCTVGEFVRRERVERARQALLTSDAATSIAQIAYVCGYADQAHLTRSFRRATGWTPAAFRRAHRGGAMPGVPSE